MSSEIAFVPKELYEVIHPNPAYVIDVQIVILTSRHAVIGM